MTTSARPQAAPGAGPAHTTRWRPRTRPSRPTTTRRASGRIVGSSFGQSLEWYDFYAYAFTAIYFKDVFFPGSDPTVQLIQHRGGVFAIGFLMRPIGGWLFGRIADRYGRKNSMLISVVMMCGRLARHRGPADLRPDRHRGADPAAARPA